MGISILINGNEKDIINKIINAALSHEEFAYDLSTCAIYKNKENSSYDDVLEFINWAIEDDDIAFADMLKSQGINFCYFSEYNLTEFNMITNDKFYSFDSNNFRKATDNSEIAQALSEVYYNLAHKNKFDLFIQT